jgi:hypothetical protein
MYQDNDQFWTSNPAILFDKYDIIIPDKTMDKTKQLNIISRDIIYLIILCLIFYADYNIIIFLLVALILIIIFYYIYINDTMSIFNENIENIKKISENFTKEFDKNYKHGDNLELNNSAITLYDSVKNKIFKNNNVSSIDVIPESGYIDSDENYKIGSNYSDINYKEYMEKIQNDKNKKISWEQNNDFIKNESRIPTINNPFTNIAFTDYLDYGNLAEPCNIDDEDLQNKMQNLYNSSIYRNIDDVWERENSQRMFYTLPIQTVPNSQSDFANWLYKTGPSCKENTQNCTYYQSPNMTSMRY